MSHLRRDSLRQAVTVHVHWIPLDLFTTRDMVNWLLATDLHPLEAASFRFSPRSVHARSVAAVLSELARLPDPPIRMVGEVKRPTPTGLSSRQKCYERC